MNKYPSLLFIFIAFIVACPQLKDLLIAHVNLAISKAAIEQSDLELPEKAVAETTPDFCNYIDFYKVSQDDTMLHRPLTTIGDIRKNPGGRITFDDGVTMDIIANSRARRTYECIDGAVHRCTERRTYFNAQNAWQDYGNMVIANEKFAKEQGVEFLKDFPSSYLWTSSEFRGLRLSKGEYMDLQLKITLYHRNEDTK